MLVIGTTGTGKTTLLKNLIFDIVRKGSDAGISSILVLDRNRDFLFALFKPNWRLPEKLLEAENELAKAVYQVDYAKLRGIDFAILLPVTTSMVSELSGKAGNIINLAKGYIERTFGMIAQRLGAEVSVSDLKVMISGKENISIKLKVKVSYRSEEYEKTILLMPFALRYGGDVNRLIEVDPYFTEFARQGLPLLAEWLSKSEEHKKKLEEKGVDLKCLDGLIRALSLISPKDYERFMHKETFQHAFRRLLTLFKTGCIDVEVALNGKSLIISEPNIEFLIKLMNDNNIKLAIADLSVISENTVVNMLCYVLLDKLREKIVEREKPANMLMLLDEAHSFFPKKRDEYGERVEGLISTLARLGRQRGLGLIFSTHRVTDLNRLVITLTNTKVVFRTSKDETEDAEVPSSWRDFVTNMPDRVALVKSHIIKAREGVLTFRTPPPLLGHREA